MKELMGKTMKKFMFRWWRCPVFKVWIPVDATREEELEMLEEAEKYFEKRLEEVRRRLKELRK